jgi:hypothetical protein
MYIITFESSNAGNVPANIAINGAAPAPLCYPAGGGAVLTQISNPGDLFKNTTYAFVCVDGALRSITVRGV